MPFERGHIKTGGRKKGAENKDKKVLRESLTKLVEGNYNKFEIELLKLEGKEFLDRFISILEYTTPKLNRTDITNDGEKFDFTVYSDAELINELKGITKLVSGAKDKGK